MNWDDFTGAVNQILDDYNLGLLTKEARDGLLENLRKKLAGKPEIVRKPGNEPPPGPGAMHFV